MFATSKYTPYITLFRAIGHLCNVEFGYSFHFNGKELDKEGMGGGGSTYDYGFRIYNAQLGKFLSVDPLTNDYPWLTPYQFASNLPINSVDLDGLENQQGINGKVYVGPYDMAAINASIVANQKNNQNRQMGTAIGYSLPNVFSNSIGGGIALPGMLAANVRQQYVRRVSQLEPLKSTDPMTGSQLRNQYVREARAKTPQPFREMAKDMKPNTKPNPNGRFWVTNSGVNQTMELLGVASTGVLLYTIANSTYNVITSEDKAQAVGQEVTIYGAAYAGGQVGGEFGAFFGPWGATIGTVGGALLGGYLATTESNDGTKVIPPVIPQDNTAVITPY